MNNNDLLHSFMASIPAIVVATWSLASFKSKYDLKNEQLKTLIKQETDHIHDQLMSKILELEHNFHISEIKNTSEEKDQNNRISSLHRTAKENSTTLFRMISDIQEYLQNSTRQCDYPFTPRRGDVEKITQGQDESWTGIK